MRWLLLTWLVLSTGMVGAAYSPVGLWKTIDDETGQAKSFVRIERLVDKSRSDARCHQCTDHRK